MRKFVHFFLEVGKLDRQIKIDRNQMNNRSKDRSKAISTDQNLDQQILS